MCRPDDFSKNFQTSLAPPLGLRTLCCVLWGPARGDWLGEPDCDREPDWECKSNFSNSILTSSSVSEELLSDDNIKLVFSGDWARCVTCVGVGDGGGYWLAGTGPWCCLRGVNKTAAAARFWEPWMRREAKGPAWGGPGGGLGVLGGLAGVIGRRGSMPSFRFEGFRVRPWRSREI